ncbi:MAG: nucleotide exchange factor GrpE [Methanomicrobiales archaeon]
MDDDNITALRKKVDQSESQYNKLKKEFKDYIENSQRNEDLKKKELQSDHAKKMLVFADSLSRMSVSVNNNSCDIVRNTNENFQKNIDAMYNHLLSISGLIPVDPAPGDKFDDTLHMAVGLEYGSRYPENTVFRVIRKGYLRENTLIRPAEVIISKRPQERTKAGKTRVWEHFTSWMFPGTCRLAQIDQQIAGLEHTRSEESGRLHQEIESLKEFISLSAAEKQETDECIQVLGETTGRLADEMDEVKEFIYRSSAEKQETDERIRILGEMIGRLTGELDTVREFIYPSAAGKQGPGDRERGREETTELLEEEMDDENEFILQPVAKNQEIIGIIPYQEEMTIKTEPKPIDPENSIPLTEPEGNKSCGSDPAQDEKNNGEEDTYERS